MSREKFLTIAVSFLLVLNTGTIGFLLLNKPSRPHELWKLVIEKVGFDESQKNAYLLLRDEHRFSMDRLDDQFEESLKRYMSTISHEANPAMEDAMSNELAEIEKMKAQLTVEHFRRVKALCKPEQVEKFNQLIPDLMPILLPPKDPKRQEREKRGR